MKLTTTALGTALAIALATAGTAPAQAPAAAAASQRKLTLSPKAQKPILDLQTAVKAKNAAAVPGLLAAANLAAKTPDDRYAIAGLQLQAAVDANDYPGLITAADALTASGAPATETSKIYLVAAQNLGTAKQYGPATTALDRVLAVDPKNSDALVLRSEFLFQQKRVPESLTSLSQAIALQKAAGQAVPESWYQARVARAYDAKLPAVYGYSREWVTAFPSASHWRDAINVYRNLSGLDRVAMIDMLRLGRATKSLSGEGDYSSWAQSLINHGYPSEGLALLQEGAASGSIKLSSPGIAQLVTLAKTRSAGEKGALAAVGKSALTAPNAAPAMRAGDGYLDAGDYGQAATLYRAALTKSGGDRNVANLRLGIALAESGDKAGATAALQSVGGAQAEIAQYWMAYLATRA